LELSPQEGKEPTFRKLGIEEAPEEPSLPIRIATTPAIPSQAAERLAPLRMVEE
jgi:hypothetical protein